MDDTTRTAGGDARRAPCRQLRRRRRHGRSGPTATRSDRYGHRPGYGRGRAASGRAGDAERRRHPVDRNGRGRRVPVRLRTRGVAHRHARERDPQRGDLFPDHRIGHHLVGRAAGARGLPRRVSAHLVDQGQGAGRDPGQSAGTGRGHRASHDRPAGVGGHDGRQRPLRVRGASGRRVHGIPPDHRRFRLRCDQLHPDPVDRTEPPARLCRRRRPFHRDRVAEDRPRRHPLFAATDGARRHDRGSRVEPRGGNAPPRGARVHEQRADHRDSGGHGLHGVPRHRDQCRGETGERGAVPARMRGRAGP